MKDLKEVRIADFVTEKGQRVADVRLTYEVEGCAWGTAPIVMVCHALTGNSSVAGPKGWWAQLIGEGQTIDTRHCTILTFNIPGNGYDGEQLAAYDLFTLKDVARLLLLGLQALRVAHLAVLIGASLGGALAWQLAYLSPKLCEKLVVIACDFKASDWLLAQTHVQQTILEHSSQPMHDARMHAMLCYRTPASLNRRFGERINESTQEYEMIEWLNYHGEALCGRFALSAYRTMTYLISTIGVTDRAENLAIIEGEVHLVSIDSDLLFSHDRAEQTQRRLVAAGKQAVLHTMESVHGHDAFLMEYEQLNEIVGNIVGEIGGRVK